MGRTLLIIRLLVCLSFVLPPSVFATTWYVRPSSDSLGNAITYGTGDGLSEANAWAGAITQASVSPGDTICLPGQDEPFFFQLGATGPVTLPPTMTSGTAGNPITYKSCAGTKALVWRAFDLTGDRSFTAAQVLITGNPTYEWVSLANNIYRKQIDVRPRILWEDATWLHPVAIDALSEAEIVALLQPGEWGNSDHGGATIETYYRATDGAKNPTNTTIRCDTFTGSGARGTLNITGSYLDFEDIELRGLVVGQGFYPFNIQNVHHINGRRIKFYQNERGPQVVTSGVYGDTPVSDILFEDFECCEGAVAGVRGSPATRGIVNWTIRGTAPGLSTYSNVYGSFYNGTTFYESDGDGIGLGFAGSDALARPWSAAVNYVIGNMVSRSRVIYTAAQASLNQQPPNATYWTVYVTNNSQNDFTTATTTWEATVAYVIGDTIMRAARNYVAIANHTNQQPPNATYWTLIPSIDGLLIENTETNYNANRGIFNGTSYSAYSVRGYTIHGLTAIGNGRGCISEGEDAEVIDTWVISGMLCGYTVGVPNAAGTTYYPALHFRKNLLAEPREIYVEHATFVGNRSRTMIEFDPHAHNNFHFKNIAFVSNPGTPGGRDGDLFSSNDALIGDEEFQNISFYSLPGQALPFAKLGGTSYNYDAADLTAFNAAANGATGTTLNVDPLLVSIGTTCEVPWDKFHLGCTEGDSSLQSSSPLIDAAVTSDNCYDVNAIACPATDQDIGAYQFDDPAADPNITITTESLPNGVRLTAYSQQLTRTNGTAPFVWSVQSGALPTGLSMDTDGLITGTPTVNGVFAFVPQVTDDNALTDATPPDLSITITGEAPAAPTGLHRVGPASETHIQLVWLPNAAADLAGYKVYQGTVSGQTTLVKTITVASAAAAHTPMTQVFLRLPVADTYYFAVAAFNASAGTIGAKSTEVSTTVTGTPARTARP